MKRRGQRLLHLFPTRAREHVTGGERDVAYVSAGWGTGPWDLALDPELSRLEHAAFDLVLIDAEDSLTHVPELDRYRFLRRLVARLRPGGLIAFPASAAETHWKSHIRHAGLRQRATAASFVLLQTANAAEVRGELAAMREYSRALELRLSAVYASRTWRMTAPIRRLTGLFRRRRPGSDPLERVRGGGGGS